MSWKAIASSVSRSQTLDLDPAMSKTSVIGDIKNVLNDPFVKRLFMVGGEIAAAFSSYAEKPTLWNGIRAAFLSGKSLVEQFEIMAYDFFDDEAKWVEPFPRDFSGAILKILKKFPYETLKTSTEGSIIHLVKLDVGTVGWITNTTKYTVFKVDRIYAETKNLEAIREKIKSLLWEQFKDKPLVLKRNQRSLRSFDEDRIVLEVDDAFDPLPSELASEYTKYLNRAINGGVNRSVMLYGPPGTGKSTLARTLVNNLKLRSFRLRIEDVGGIDNSTLFEAIDIFKPDAIILDDFDRAGSQEQLLETCEHFEKNIKLVIATVNKRDKLDEALLRPGRFDELVLVKRMDDNVIKNELGAYVDVFNQVKDWPIAFIVEYVKRRQFLTKREAMKTIKELAARVERLGEYDEEAATAKVLGKKSTKQKARRKVLMEASDMDSSNPLEDLLSDEDEDD